MVKRTLAFAAIVGLVFGVLAGCDNTGEQQRSVVVVQSVNNDVPVVVDVYEQGDSLFLEDGVTWKQIDDFIAQAWMVVEFQNMPYNGLVTTGPGAPHSDFLINRYHIDWTRIDGGTTALPSRDGATSVVIPTGDHRPIAVLLVNFEEMRLPLLSDLRYNSGLPSANSEIMMRADLTFWGHEVGTERETEIKLSVSVSFVDLFIETDKKN